MIHVSHFLSGGGGIVALQRDAAPAGAALLEVSGVTKEFRGFRALNTLSLRVAEHTVHALVGPNGAGKTTLFNVLTGFVKPTAGKVLLAGQDVTRLSPDCIARCGVARSFQIASLFEQLTALEHVVLALQASTSLGYRFWWGERALRRFTDQAMDGLAQVGLAALAERPVHTLAYGDKRALELAIALAVHPRLLLLDEPTAGMSLADVHRMIDLLRRVRAGRTIVFVEHNMGVVSAVADRVTVLSHGTVLAEGSYAEVRDNPQVIAAYLGQTHA
jgi:branched-chain amino acid transport system ATP-binding protein